SMTFPSIAGVCPQSVLRPNHRKTSGIALSQAFPHADSWPFSEAPIYTAWARLLLRQQHWCISEYVAASTLKRYLSDHTQIALVNLNASTFKLPNHPFAVANELWTWRWAYSCLRSSL